MKGILGKKVGMTQIFDEQGQVTPITIIEAGPCFVAQIKKTNRDGYTAVQLGFAETKPKRLTNAQLEHLKKSNLPALRHLREFRMDEEEIAPLEEGQKITVDIFQVGEFVDVTGISKGKGFAGVMKRHHFHGGPITHGQSDRQRIAWLHWRLQDARACQQGPPHGWSLGRRPGHRPDPEGSHGRSGAESAGRAGGGAGRR